MLGTGAGSHPGLRFENPEELGKRSTMEDVLLGGYIPEEHVKDLDIDGVDVSIIYPTVGGTLYSVPDSDLLTSMTSIYNDWLSEFCKANPRRLKGIAMLNVDDVTTSVKELERSGQAGAVVGASSRCTRLMEWATTCRSTILYGQRPRTWEYP